MIPFIQLNTPEKRELLPTLFLEMEQLFESSQFILGKQVEVFEKKLADWIGCQSVVGVNSGLDALILALKACGIGKGDEVITASNSYLASASAIELTGARAVFADIGRDYNLDPEEVERRITPRTKAILLVHLTGTPCDMAPFLELRARYGIELIEDAAQAIGATYDGKQVGNFGRFGCFSLHPLKNLHVWGDGGFITVHHKEDLEILLKLRNHGLRNRNETEIFSLNSRLDSIQAIVGNHFLDLLESTIQKRSTIAHYYQAHLATLTPEIKLPHYDHKRIKPVFHVFQIRSRRRDVLAQYLFEHGIETKIHYPVPIHLQPAAIKLGYQKGDFPVTETFAEEILSIPVRESLTEMELDLIIKYLSTFRSKTENAYSVVIASEAISSIKI